jgi:LacI family transcriptional regulator
VDIPGRVDLAGIDDACPFDVLPLTAVAVVLPSREMGASAVQLLHSRVVGRAADPELIVLPVTVRVRDSMQAHLRVVGGL